jgi:hypothetical protein
MGTNNRLALAIPIGSRLHAMMSAVLPAAEEQPLLRIFAECRHERRQNRHKQQNAAQDSPHMRLKVTHPPRRLK